MSLGFLNLSGGTRLVLLLLTGLLCISSSTSAQVCDCRKGMEHLCRCNVLIDNKVANQQLAYLNRLLEAEFREFLDQSPVTEVRVGKKSEMRLKGEAAQGYINTQPTYGEGMHIVLNPGLRRDEALMVLAHELGHAWQFGSRSDADKVDDFMAEGFAEWVAFHLTKRAGLTEFSYRIKNNPDPLYGAGFRWYFDLETKHGVGSVISVMLNWVDRSGHRSVAP